MKRKIVLLSIFAVLAVSTYAYCQEFPPHPMGKHKELIMQYRDLEMLKALNLTQEESQIALPIIKDIDNNRETFHETQNDILNEIESALDKDDKKVLSQQIDSFIEAQKDFEERQDDLYTKLRKNLSDEKFARYILFMRNFGKTLQEKIHHMMDDKPKMDRPNPQKP